MKITQTGVDLIKQFEACKLTAYLCPAQKWTIGYGHTGPDVRAGRVITQSQAETILQADVAIFDTAVQAQCPSATASQHDAMTCLAFNIGIGNFCKSSVARLHNAGNIVGAARAFALWNKATDSNGVKRELRGLTRRRAAEAALYLSDLPDQRTRAADVVPEKPLSTSRVMVGSTVGGAATVASGLAQLSTDIQSLKDMVSPLMPYLPVLQKVFVALSVLGVGVAMYARWQDRKQGRV
jgi:lysozyme